MRIHVMRYCSLLALSVAAIVLLEGCSTVPVTGRKQLNLVSEGEEMQLGLSSFEQLKKETPINHDPAINAMVQRVGKRIAAVATKDMPNAQWEFVVFDSKEANAFCLPGGKVGVYTGILPITQTDAGLATVIGPRSRPCRRPSWGGTHERPMALAGRWTGGRLALLPTISGPRAWPPMASARK